MWPTYILQYGGEIVKWVASAKRGVIAHCWAHLGFGEGQFGCHWGVCMLQWAPGQFLKGDLVAGKLTYVLRCNHP